jgi:hypothetical protein
MRKLAILIVFLIGIAFAKYTLNISIPNELLSPASAEAQSPKRFQLQKEEERVNDARIDVLCDLATGNLIYRTYWNGDIEMSIAPNGCTKDLNWNGRNGPR